MNILGLACSGMLEVISGTISLSHHHTLKSSWFNFEFLDFSIRLNDTVLVNVSDSNENKIYALLNWEGVSKGGERN